MQPIRKPIRVAVIFGPGGKIAPKWFELNNRKHEVKLTTYAWRDRVGETLLMHYAVSDGETLFELVYNTHDQIWSLNALQAE
ncbi:hypothetical protein F6V30_14530 [Oryzomonas sagensis]|uniref:Uncharacterized protein n=1 Tax=Oryzomonas sagensis TaxID=2603857 RepID=A0ABQ6TL93_9BACT|nr:hypothetical protein [Oryzomonas sagensis]KAB0669047.1 hypothetical protein F6V30_14530 [Oryzomonas sagensis]